MAANKVVIHFKDGTIKKGNTSDFLPNKKSFHLSILGGDVETIEVENLKAVFFVKDYEGNKDHKRDYKDIIAGGGKKVEVSFNDGETIVVVGRVLSNGDLKKKIKLVAMGFSSKASRIN